MAEVIIFHTSDFHSRLDEQGSLKLAALKESAPDSLLLDSGDAIKSGNITFNPWGESMLSLMNQAGYDAMCVGNREYHFMAGPMKAKTFKAGFPILSSNMIKRGDNPAIEPYVDFIRSGIRIRIMGLSVPCVTKQMFVHHLANQYFEDPVKTGALKAIELRKGCDVLIALTHIGLKKDIELAEKAEVLDLILGGHTHTITDEPVNVGKTVILHHGFHAKNVGKVNIRFENGHFDVDNQLLELRA